MAKTKMAGVCLSELQQQQHKVSQLCWAFLFDPSLYLGMAELGAQVKSEKWSKY